MPKLRLMTHGPTQVPGEVAADLVQPADAPPTRRELLTHSTAGLIAAGSWPLLATGCAESPGGRRDHDPAPHAGPGPLQVTGTTGPSLARITAPVIGAHWDYRVPETLSCREGQFKVYYHPIVTWQGPDADGSVWYEWETSPTDTEALLKHPRANVFGSAFIEGVRYRVTIRPSALGLDLTFMATNKSDRVFHDLTLYPCLGRSIPAFHDETLTRTFVMLEGKPTPMGQLRRGTVDPRRTHIRVEGQPPMPFVNTSSWGEAGPTRIDRGAIVRTDATGKWTIGTAWQRCAEVFYNEDPHHCIHSVGAMGDIAPGESATLRGKIVFVTGGPQEAFDSLDWD